MSFWSAVNKFMNPEIDYWKNDEQRFRSFSQMAGIKVEFVHHQDDNTLEIIATDADYRVSKIIKKEHWLEPLRNVLAGITWKRFINEKENKNIPNPPFIKKLNLKGN